MRQARPPEGNEAGIGSDSDSDRVTPTHLPAASGPDRATRSCLPPRRTPTPPAAASVGFRKRRKWGRGAEAECGGSNFEAWLKDDTNKEFLLIIFRRVEIIALD